MSSTQHTPYQDGAPHPGLTAPLAEPTSLLRSQARGLLGISLVFAVCTWVAVGLRCYVRLRLLKRFGVDDGVMVLTLVGNPWTDGLGCGTRVC